MKNERFSLVDRSHFMNGLIWWLTGQGRPDSIYMHPQPQMETACPQTVLMNIKLPILNWRLSATSLICLLALPAASGQTPARPPSVAGAAYGAASKRRMTEPLEKYNMPPAYIYRLETGPRMISQFGQFTSFQVNVDAGGNNILADAANETSITCDPTNPNT